MKFLVILFLSSFFSVDNLDNSNLAEALNIDGDNIEITVNSDALSFDYDWDTTVIQCGDDPDGNWGCVTYEFDDGSDCIIVDNEGAPGGIAFFGC